MTSPRRTCAVLGGGPAAATVSAFLARAGHDVVIFYKPHSIEPMVGESLLPPVVPILHDLGLASDLQQFATVKPGLSFVLRTGRVLSFNLGRLQNSNAFAYNVPRPLFDNHLRMRAVELGARVIEGAPAISRAEGDDVALDPAGLAAAGWDRQPDLFVDATGRRKLISQTVGNETEHRGKRQVSLYAHFEDVVLGAPEPGHAVITPLERGWCWRIPLPGRISVGIVAPPEALSVTDSDLGARLESILRSDTVMGPAMANARRVSEGRTLVSQHYRVPRLIGGNWALVGDAAGFVDPALSPGVSVAMESAFELAKAVCAAPEAGARGLVHWAQRSVRRLDAWGELVEYFYDGSLFAMIQQGEDLAAESPWLGPFNRFMERTFAGVILGVGTMSRLDLGLVRLSIQKGLRQYQAKDWAIQG